MNLDFLIDLIAALWLISIAACVMAWRWSFLGRANRFWASVVLSASALIVGYLGLTRFRVSGSKTVNGRVIWSFNSRWFFIATLILAAATLAYTVWKHRKSAPPTIASPTS